MPDKIKVWIIEDQEAIRDGLQLLLNTTDWFSEITTFHDGEAALQAINIIELPKLILLDLGLPGISGLQTLTYLKENFPNSKILVITINDEDENIFEALKFGASGYILKKEKPENMLKSIEEVLEGGAPMSREISVKVLTSFRQIKSPKTFEGLSERELEVLDYLAHGYLYKEISGFLNISQSTVKNHLQNIYQKLHVHTRSEAIIKYMKGNNNA